MVREDERKGEIKGAYAIQRVRQPAELPEIETKRSEGRKAEGVNEGKEKEERSFDVKFGFKTKQKGREEVKMRDVEVKTLEILDDYEKTSDSSKIDLNEYLDDEKDINLEAQFSVPTSMNFSIPHESQSKDILSKIFSKNYSTEKHSIMDIKRNNHKRLRMMKDIEDAISYTK